MHQPGDVPGLLDTQIQTVCEDRPPPFLGANGRPVFADVLIHAIHASHGAVVMFDEEGLANIQSSAISSGPAFG
jgi:hypothetical protein